MEFKGGLGKCDVEVEKAHVRCVTSLKRDPSLSFLVNLPAAAGVAPVLLVTVDLAFYTVVMHMSEAPPITRDPDLWFEDGNLVIQVTPRLFRLHRGILAAHSNFFRNMADFPASQEQSTYDGVPLVILHDDNAHDAGHFFKAIYIFE